MDIMNVTFHSTMEKIEKEYTKYLWSGDPRTQHHFAVRTPWFLVTMLAIYLTFVTKVGPALMKNRQPFQLRSILIVYNLIVTAMSIYITWMMAVYGWFGKYNWVCEPMDFSALPEDIFLSNISYLYFVTKFIEMMDTVFFVLRKKSNQLTFLHIYHHSIMPINVYFGLKFCSTGHITMFGMLNSFIHIPMYLYYGLSAIGPSVQKYLWWKKYLTMSQLIQFVIVGVHSGVGIANGCNTSRPLLYALIYNVVVFIGLFANFYIKAYTKKPVVEKQKDKDNNNIKDRLRSSPKTSRPESNGSISHNLRPRILKTSISSVM